MRQKIIIIISIILVLFLIIGIIMLIKQRNYVEIGKIKLFKYSYTNGYYMYADKIYELEYKNNKYYASLKPEGISEENKITVEVDENISKKIEEILNKYDVGTWNEFNKSDSRVLDGNSFNLDIKFINDEKIYASGYMMWPKNYFEFKNEIINLYDDIFEKDK